MKVLEFVVIDFQSQPKQALYSYSPFCVVADSRFIAPQTPGSYSLNAA